MEKEREKIEGKASIHGTLFGTYERARKRYEQQAMYRSWISCLCFSHECVYSKFLVPFNGRGKGNLRTE